jgi:hypothetical protein
MLVVICDDENRWRLGESDVVHCIAPCGHSMHFSERMPIYIRFSFVFCYFLAKSCACLCYVRVGFLHCLHLLSS